MSLPKPSHKDLERRLSRVPGDPTPPPGLLQALKNDIPADLGRPAAPPAPPWWQAHGLRAAAAVLLMVGAGIAALLLWPRMDLRMSEAPVAASAPVEEAAESRAEGFEDAALEEKESEVIESADEIDQTEVSAGLESARRDEAGEALKALGYMGSADDLAFDAEPAPAEPVPPPAGIVSEHRKLSPPPPPARPMPKPAPKARPQADSDIAFRGGSPRVEADAVGSPAAPPPPAADIERRLEERRALLSLPEPQATIEDEIVVRGETPQVISEGTTSASTAAGAPAPALDPTSFAREVSDQPFTDTRGDRFSTFGLDVDTGSYTLARRYLTEGRLPPPKILRVEEWINAVDMGDPAPAAGATFGFTFEGAGSPFGGSWSPFGNTAGHRYFLRLGLKAREIAVEDRPPVALTFLVDTSGSMNGPDRLGLVRQALAALSTEGRPGDTVAVVRYGSEARIDLPPTEDLSVLPQVAAGLASDGSTHLEAGLRMAYGVTAEHLRPEADHRVVLLSDGVANQGATEVEALLQSVEEHADRGIELTVVGLGMGDYRDDLLEQLADRGDGRYAYVDRLEDLETVFFEELHGARRTVAEEARVQIEWNPAAVMGYRLLGYENRAIADHEFRYHRTDGGEVGAGHAVSALYEVILAPTVPPGRTLGLWQLRYRDPDTGQFVEEQRRLERDELLDTWNDAPATLRFSAEIAESVHLLEKLPPARVRRLEAAADRLAELMGSLRETEGEAVDPRMGEMAEVVARAAEVAARE